MPRRSVSQSIAFCGLLVLALLAMLQAPAAQAQLSGKSYLKPSLVAETKTIVPGKPFSVGLLLKMDPSWHTYWEYPGEFGFKVSAEWTLPPGFTAGPIQWPLPTLHLEDGQVSYNYEHEVMLLVEITPPADLPPGELTLAAKLKWQVCEESPDGSGGRCVPGNGTVELPLATGAEVTPDKVDLFAKWRAELPKAPAPFPVQWAFPSAKELQLTLGPLPEGTQKVDFYPLPPMDAAGAFAAIVAVPPKIGSPKANGDREISVTLDPKAEPTSPWRGVVVTTDAAGHRTGWQVAPPSGQSTPPPLPPGATTSAGGADTATKPETKPQALPHVSFGGATRESKSLAGILLFGFLGGLILNVMPCVLPVIALKIFGFVQQAGHEPGRVFRLGLAYVAGVFAFFLSMAVLVIGLKTAGKSFNLGFQFQNPYLLAGLIGLVFVFAMNLLGVFEITLASGATSALSEAAGHEGYGGAFVHGLFTTLLGTSCSAPFLGPSLGYALTQPALVVVLFFLTMAIGMSLPYLLLTARPAWMKFLPKPGAWMERFKQVIGFVMLGVGVWLFTVFAERGGEAIKALSWYLFALGLACWLLGVLARRGLALVLAVIIAVGGYFGLLHGRLEATIPSGGDAATAPGAEKPGSIAWQPFTEERVTEALAKGQPILIDFTASWCWNCHVLEKTVLETDPIRQAVQEKKIVALRADWSKPDPVIEAWLTRFQRAAVPFFLLYRPGEEQPVQMDWLTTKGLLAEMHKIK